MVFERYSDSAAAFVRLDSDNAGVYKQLYRAAKAKLKLRIKATVTRRPLESQATINLEAPKAEVPALGLPPYLYYSTPASSQPVMASPPVVAPATSTTTLVNTLRERLNDSGENNTV